MRADIEGQPLEQVQFTVLDVETTGLVPELGDRVCEIALLHFQGGRELKRFHSLVNPGRPVSPGAYAVNGITEEELVDAPLFAQIAPSVREILQGSVLVAHNAPFDLGFLDAEFDLCRLPTPANPVVDTLALARRCYRFPSNRLGSVARYLGVNTCGEHRALFDVLTTKALLEQMLIDLSEHGVSMIDHLVAAQGGPIGWPRRESIPLPPEIQEALTGDGRIWIRYLSAGGRETHREVTPLRVTVRGGYLYLVAVCHLRNEQRTFRLDRVLEMAPAV